MKQENPSILIKYIIQEIVQTNSSTQLRRDKIYGDLT
jgi:hypothetical protein